MDTSPIPNGIEERLLSRYPGDYPDLVTLREFIAQIYRRHVNLGLADSTFESNLCCGDASTYLQRLSEALFAHHLLEAGLHIRPSSPGCPDICVQLGASDVWIEVICPQPERVPTEWLQPIQATAGCVTVRSLPHEAIFLRWTAAIKEKAEKLIGRPAKEGTVAKPGYLEKGVVSATDPYVIAVNGRLLRGEYFPSILGISQWPYAVEAVFPVGPYQVKLDSLTLEVIETGHQYRPSVENHNRSLVPATMFLNPNYRHVSAIWAADMDEKFVIGNGNSMAIIHNPNAANPISPGVLPAHREYLASVNRDEFAINCVAGCLNEV